jgi:small subunit ribosomal protein S7
MRRPIKKRLGIEPDFKYQSVVVAKFINNVMKNGKKSVAEKVVYDALNKVQEITKKEPLEILNLALSNVAPLLEIKSRRIGGATYQVPREVRGERKQALAFRWILNASRSKKGKPMSAKLADELILASKNEGTAVKKKIDMHRMAEANKAFAHFSW